MKHALKTLAVFSALLTATYSISGKAAEMKKASIDTIFDRENPILTAVFLPDRLI